MKELNEYTNVELIDELKRRTVGFEMQKTLVPEQTTPREIPKVKKEMFPAVCSLCGKACQVPFEPKEGYGIKCIECYKYSNNSK